MRFFLSCAAAIGPFAALAQPVFTGNAPADFPEANPAVTILVDSGGIDVGIPDAFPDETISGNDLEDVRIQYHPPTDTLFVAFNTYVVAGDVDGNGAPGGTSPILSALGGVDIADFGGSESFAVLLDIDEDGTFDVVAGVGIESGLEDFQVAAFDGFAAAPALSFGEPIVGVEGVVFATPSQQAPDLEFTISNFSTLPSSGIDRSATFGFNAFMGSLADAGFGEDFVPGSNQTVSICPDREAVETCNGFDEDCDGGFDEDFSIGQVCVSGVGGCAVMGVNQCNDVGGAECDAEPGDPVAESCNGIDDDCDGVTDELIFGDECEADAPGVCAAGRTQCVEGSMACLPAVEAVAELCNGLDDDCDGSTDEDFNIGGACKVGVGGCEEEGVWQCAEDGTAECIGEPGEMQPEICDDIDNDCDGEVDETFGVGETCDAGLGACSSEGQRICAPDGSVVCDAEAGDPRPEVCDGTDTDCDGAIDNVVGVGAACTHGLGACQTTGRMTCGDEGRLVCDAETLERGTAFDCAGQVTAQIDEDCDGVVDEDADSVDCDPDGNNGTGGPLGRGDGGVDQETPRLTGADAGDNCSQGGSSNAPIPWVLLLALPLIVRRRS